VQKNVKRNVAIGVAAVVVLGGGGIAVAATTSKSSESDRQKAFIEDAAKRLSVTPDQLTSALKGAFGDQLDDAVKDGKLTQKQADALKQRLEQGGLPLGGGPGFGGGGKRGPGGPGFGHGGPGGPGAGVFGAGLDTAASYLGLTEKELRAKLDDKTSLADVAKAQGKDAAGLEAAIVAAAKERLDAAVKDGKLTADQRDELEQDLAARVKEQVEHAGPPKGGPRGPGGPDGGGAPRGFPGHP